MKILIKLVILLKLRYDIKIQELRAFARIYFWEKKLANFGDNTKIYGKIEIVGANRISIGKNCTLNHGVYINGKAKIVIGDNTRISPYVTIVTGGLLFKGDPPYKHHQSEIIIGNNVWIASHAVILPGVIIGDNAIIGAGAIVNKNVEKNSIVGGVPAKKIH